MISVHDYNLPRFYSSRGTSLAREKLNQRSSLNTQTQLLKKGIGFRPSFIYGKRKVDGFEIPLDIIGESLERLLLAVESFIKPWNLPPASDLLLAAPLSVDDIAYAVINVVMDDDFFGIFTIKQTK